MHRFSVSCTSLLWCYIFFVNQHILKSDRFFDEMLDKGLLDRYQHLKETEPEFHNFIFNPQKYDNDKKVAQNVREKLIKN